METQKHINLKQIAKDFLSIDFDKNEIFFEYKVIINDKKYIVDIAAISENKRIAVEIGVLNTKDRLKTLSSYFDKIIHLPYIDYKKEISLRNGERIASLRLTEWQTKMVEEIVKRGDYMVESEIYRRALNIGLKEILLEIKPGEEQE
jgi:hypothetical protein